LKLSRFINLTYGNISLTFNKVVIISCLSIFFTLGCSETSTSENKTIFSGDVLDSKGDYSAEMFKIFGWKASKEFPKDSLPKATNIWYGFYKQKDVELRFYNSHSDLKTYGINEAELTVSMGKPEFHQGGIDKTRLGYGAYLIAGNVIIMCEAEVNDCLELVQFVID